MDAPYGAPSAARGIKKSEDKDTPESKGGKSCRGNNRHMKHTCNDRNQRNEGMISPKPTKHVRAGRQRRKPQYRMPSLAHQRVVPIEPISTPSQNKKPAEVEASAKKHEQKAWVFGGVTSGHNRAVTSGHNRAHSMLFAYINPTLSERRKHVEQKTMHTVPSHEPSSTPFYRLISVSLRTELGGRSATDAAIRRLRANRLRLKMPRHLLLLSLPPRTPPPPSPLSRLENTQHFTRTLNTNTNTNTRNNSIYDHTERGLSKRCS